MADRKVLIKYIPKNFDPKLLVKRGRGKDKLMNVRNMLPMSLRCNVCHNYLYIGTKFNMRMEICNEETYLGIKVFRFYLKCTYCYNEIAFKTDPKNHDYIVEDGGTRNYQPIKDAQQAQKLMTKMKKQEKEGNSMKFLQTRTYDSKRQMELMEALDDIKCLNKRNALIDVEDLLNNLFVLEEDDQKFSELEEQAIQQKFRELRKKKLMEMKQKGQDVGEKLESILEEEQQCNRKQEQKQKKQELEKNAEEKNGQKQEAAIGDVKLEERSNPQLVGQSVIAENPRLYAMQKSSLFKLGSKQQTVKVPKNKLPPKKKVIRKGLVEGKQKKDEEEDK